MIRVLIAEWNSEWQTVLHGEATLALQEIGVRNINIQMFANYGQASQWLTQEGPWSLLISDITLSPEQGYPPAMFGKLLLRRAKDLQIPSIAVSGSPALNLQDIRDILLHLGASEFYYKPMFANHVDEYKNLVQRLVTLSLFPLSQRKLIADTITQLEPTQLGQILVAFNKIENRENEDNQQRLNDVEMIFNEILSQGGLEGQIRLKADVETISTLLATPRLDTVQKLLITIPIIPGILTYQAQCQFPNLNLRNRLQNLWNWFTN